MPRAPLGRQVVAGQTPLESSPLGPHRTSAVHSDTRRIGGTTAGAESNASAMLRSTPPMNQAALIDTARVMMAPGKGLLAMDESFGTIGKRFAAHGIPQTEAMRRAWREVLVDAPGLGEAVSGAILFDETLGQRTQDGRRFMQVLLDAGIVPGIKVDRSTTELAGHVGESITEGLDGLRQRLQDYANAGARFAKWRAVIHVAPGLPTRAAIDANVHALARYAALCQEAALVPIVEPEVLMDGSHTLARCEAVTTEVLHAVFDQLHRQDVLLEGMVLKPNMVLPGLQGPDCDAIEAVADASVRCLLRTVPAAVAGVAFLSGGQTADLATARLKAMRARHGRRARALPLAADLLVRPSAAGRCAGRLGRRRCRARRGAHGPAAARPQQQRCTAGLTTDGRRLMAGRRPQARCAAGYGGTQPPCASALATCTISITSICSGSLGTRS